MISHVILDRDGTLIRHAPYLHKTQNVEILPTVILGLQELKSHGIKLFLHTNQSGIGRGYFSLAEAIACNEEMIKQINLGKDLFEDVCICPEKPNDEIQFRKPSPKYGLLIMERYNIFKTNMCYVGDNISDLMTAKNIGCPGMGVNTGVLDLTKAVNEDKILGGDPVFNCFLDAARYIINYK